MAEGIADNRTNQMKRMGEIIEAVMTAIGIAFITGVALLIAGLIVLVHKTIMNDD